jgi:pilus assembly protein CpaB
MRAKSLILLVVALGCGMVAAVAVSKAVMDQGSGEVAEATVDIFVAVQDLQTNQKILPELVKLEPWPKSRLPEGAIFKMEQLEEKYTNQAMFAGEPLLQQKVVEFISSISTTLPNGYRIFDLPAGTSTYLKPGDHLDVIGTFKVDPNGSVAESRTVMRDVEVFAINGVMIRDPDGKPANGPSMLQLKVKESQIEALTLAQKLGDLRVTLRPFGEENKDLGPSQVDNGESFLSWVQQTGGKSPQSNLQPQQPAQGFFAESKSSEPNEMLIITPTGVSRYQWNNDKEMPRLVNDSPSTGAQANAAPGQGDWQASGSAFTGFGGYKPSYPGGDGSRSQSAVGNGNPGAPDDTPQVE